MHKQELNNKINYSVSDCIWCSFHNEVASTVDLSFNDYDIFNKSVFNKIKQCINFSFIKEIDYKIYEYNL